MALSTPVQVATVASTSSNAATASSSSSSGNRYHLHQSSEPPKTIASMILKRHVEQRQRFDSADYALIQSAAAMSAVNAQQQRRFVSCGTMADEQEPEPEAPKQDTAPPSPSRLAIDTLSVSNDNGNLPGGYPQQNVRRIRLQRFDSADWVMDALLSNSASPSSSSPKRSPRTSPRPSCRDTSTQTSVAKLILDRHAYTTCHFVTTPVDKPQRCAEKA